MADYHSPTVVDPVLPLAAMTPLEHLVLSLVFDAQDEEDGLYFHSWCGPSDMITLPLEDLREASKASRSQAESVIGVHVEALIAALDAKGEAEARNEVDLDLSTPEIGWDRILQDIVRRASNFDEIIVWTAFTCTKMRADGFGGAVMRITANAIQYDSTDGMLCAMHDAERPTDMPDIPADGGDTHARLETLAASAGWDGFTLLLLIAAWADGQGHAAALVGHLDGLATAGNG